MESYRIRRVEVEWKRLLRRYSLEKQYFLKIKRMAENEFPEDIETHEITGDPSVLHHVDMEKSHAFLMKAVHFLSLQVEHPKSSILFLLEIGNVLARDESTFNKLNSEKVFHQLISISKPTMLNSSEDIKFIFLSLLNGSLLHPSGVKWMIETNYCMDVYVIILQQQNINNERCLNLGYTVLTTLIEKAIKENQIFCIEFLKFLIRPMLSTLQQLKKPSLTSVKVYKQKIYENIAAHGTCLVEILEKLLKNQSSQVLNFLLGLEIREAADNIASISDDENFTITMYRTIIILSLYELNELFTGIKVINQNVLALSGIHRIVEREIEKGNVFITLEIVHYAIKYSKSEGFNLPKYAVRDRLVDIESEYMVFQLIPVIVISEYMASTNWWDLNDGEDVRQIVRIKITLDVLKNCSVKTICDGYKMRTQIINGPMDVCIQSLDIIMKTKEFYSTEKLNRILIVLVLTLDALHIYFIEETKIGPIKYEEKMLVEKLIEIIVDIIETPNLSLDNQIKCIDIPTILHHFLNSIIWPSPIVVKGLRFLKLSIVRHMSPNMHLLIDSIQDSTVDDIGHMLLLKLFDSDWEVRQVTLNVVTTISFKANRSFPSFRKILINASLPKAVLMLSIEDKNPLVRAAAFLCLQEIFVISGIDEKLRPDEVTDKVLTSIQGETDSFTKREAIKLIGVIYWHNKDTEHYKYLTQMYTCLEQVAHSDNNYLVQQEVLNFWKMVESNHMRSIGWTDESFPPILFCKKIIRMTKKEAEKRIFKVLNELSSIGCLNVIKHFCKCDNLSKEVSKSLDEWLFQLHTTYCRYEVTDISLALYEMYLDNSSPPVNVMSPLQEDIIGSDEFMELLDEFIPKIDETPEYKELMSTSCLSDTPQNSTGTNVRMSPSEFVHLVYSIKQDTTKL